MTESSVVGRVVGEPACPDPHHTGLKFSIDTGSRRHDFQVAGDSPLEQSPLSALAMSAALAAADEERPPVKLQGYRLSKARIDLQINRLLAMTPASYVGKAAELARRV